MIYYLLISSVQPDGILNGVVLVRLLVFFFAVSALFSAAIPPATTPISFADIILLSLSIFSVIYFKKRGMIWAYFAMMWFIVSSSIGGLRGIEASIITGMSLGLKWIGALTLFFFLSKNTRSTSIAVKTISLVQILILVSLITGMRPFSDDYYNGFNGVFQASADGGFYLICSLGFFLVLHKADPSKFNGFNVLISSLALLMVDSRFGVLLGSLVVVYYLVRSGSGRVSAFVFFAIVLIGIVFEVLPLPSKIQVLLGEINNPIGLIGSDISMLIRFNNFSNAFEFTSLFGYLVGNGGKFFQLNYFKFFEDNYSLDNSYIYILLSFGLPGLVLFCMVFLSRQGFNILGRGPLTFVVLSFAFMQDVFSNSFCLISLSLFSAVLTSTKTMNFSSIYAYDFTGERKR